MKWLVVYRRLRNLYKYYTSHFFSYYKIFKLVSKGNNVGTGVFIGPRVRFSGNNIKIGSNSIIIGDSDFEGPFEIGDNVIIAAKANILARNHDITSTSNALPYGTKYFIKKVTIKNNVWIGKNCSIVPGVTIDEGAVVAMGSVVTKDVNKCEIVGGNPAKVIKKRDEANYEFLKSKNILLTDFRGKNKVNFFKRLKHRRKISRELLLKGYVNENEICSDVRSIRKLLYNFYEKNKSELNLAIGDNGVTLTSNQND